MSLEIKIKNITNVLNARMGVTFPTDPYIHFSKEVLKRKVTLFGHFVLRKRFSASQVQDNFQSPTSFSKLIPKWPFGILRYAFHAQDGWVELVTAFDGPKSRPSVKFL
ncbi:hypothetical protein C1645_811520 [Glomus cerebriforme]|uniref:Uncharacterized protein n=1 Tax=Glomus cerebriforme TaxID=658196 RepID=A0A397TWE9_9GLOM|nr:hypothetical protein C1645_811520 [Glomus cerebriforme]